MQVPFLDLKTQHAMIRGEMMPAIEAVIDSQDFVNGPAVAELEAAVAAYSGCKSGVGVSSGTDAILCSLMALGMGAGDEVITTPYTFFSTAGCIRRCGARPVFVDIEADTYNIDPSRIEPAITEKTKAIIPVHLFGQMAEMEAIMAVARRHGLSVIEDAAQAIGATFRGRKAGSIGTAGCLSFYPSKNLGGLGDGGMIVTQDPHLAEQLACLRGHGQAARCHYKWIGGNFRLDTIQAAGLLVKLQHLADWSAQRRANASKYNDLFAGLEAVTTPVVRQGCQAVCNYYVIRVPRRDELQEFLRSEGIGTTIYYPVSLHEQECFADLGYKRGEFPVSELAADQTLALPMYPELTGEQIEYVVDRVNAFLS